MGRVRVSPRRRAWQSRAPGQGCPVSPTPAGGLVWLGLVPKEGQGPHQVPKRLQHLQVTGMGCSTGQARQQGLPYGVGLLGGESGTLESLARLPLGNPGPRSGSVLLGHAPQGGPPTR